MVYKLLFLVMVFFSANWLWDVSHIVYYSGNGVLGNGLWFAPADLVYHLSWYVSVACFVALAFLYAKEKEGKK